jgi:stalled ribosome alternative rescue factor ArfA
LFGEKIEKKRKNKGPINDKLPHHRHYAPLQQEKDMVAHPTTRYKGIVYHQEAPHVSSKV